jgi:DNA-binding response OmpR family regulator
VTLRRQVKCLVVEPQLGMRNLLDDLLSVSDCEVDAVASESEALKMLRAASSDYEVILCPAPPVGAKHCLVSKVRHSQGELKDVPVLCHSHAGGLQERAMAYESGASEYVLLPVSPTELDAAVRRWAGRAHKPY